MSHPDQARPHDHEHEEKSKARQPHAPHEEHHKGPHDTSSDPEVNPKLASDIAFWSHELGVTGEKLHEAIRTHGTKVAKLRTALHK